MRLFTGIDLPTEIKNNLDALIAQLRPAARLKWSPVKNLHVTTKFIGEWPEDRVDEMITALRQLPDRDPINIAIRGLGWFPNPRNPRVFWAAVNAPHSLAELAQATDEAVARMGIPPETRPFAPHLTLARIKERVPLGALHEAINSVPSDNFGEFTADSFNLYLSKLQPTGSVYTRLAEFTFAKT